MNNLKLIHVILFSILGIGMFCLNQYIENSIYMILGMALICLLLEWVDRTK